MTTAPTPSPRDVAGALVDDGDQLDMPGGFLRLVIGPDEFHSFDDDGDWYGRVEWDDRRRTDYAGRRPRPDGFDGRARVIYRDGGDRLWWQPPADLADDVLDSFGRTLTELATYGWNYVAVERWETLTDSRGEEHAVRVDSDAVYGVDLVGSHDENAAHVRELVTDLAHEVLS
jgi:hypothetical protein